MRRNGLINEVRGIRLTVTSSRSVIALSVVAGLALAACSSDKKAETPAASGASTAAAGAVTGEFTVGSANFPENVLLMEMYAQALEAKGAKVSRKPGIGNRETYYAVVKGGDVDLVPDYTNSLLSFVTKGSPNAKNVAEQQTRLAEVLAADKLSVLTPSTAEDKDVLACNADTVAKLKLATLEDVAKNAGEIVLGGPPEFASRKPWGLPGLEEVYGAKFKEFKPLDTGGPITVKALAANEVQCANLFSTQSAIPANKFVVMTDTKAIVPAEAVIPLVSADVSGNAAAVAAVNAVNAALDTPQLLALVAKVEIDKADPAKVAAEFLKAKGLA
jgi:osmoprotectant transport system substrate-binding protein